MGGETGLSGRVERRLRELPEEISDAIRAYSLERSLSLDSQVNLLNAALAWWRITRTAPWEADSETIRRFLSELKAGGRSERTAWQYHARLSALVRWKNGGKPPEAWGEVRLRVPKRTDLRDKVLSPEEVRALVKAGRSPMHKAAMAVLYEGALRASELCSLRMRDLEFTDYGFRIRVRGKTGVRTIPLHDSAPYLRAWLQVHPRPGDPDAPLFLDRAGSPLTRAALYQMVRRAGEKAGLGKRVHPHMLRHTRLTELARELTEQELKVFAGWTQSSDMAAVYVHLSGRDVEESILRKVHHIEPEEERVEESPLRPEACPNCGYVNPRDAEFCLRCGYPLTEGARRRVAEKRKELNELIVALLNDPKVREALLEALTRGEGSQD